MFHLPQMYTYVPIFITLNIIEDNTFDSLKEVPIFKLLTALYLVTQLKLCDRGF